MYPYRWREEGKPVTMFTSSDYAELERAARLLRVIPLLKHSRVAVFQPLRGTPTACDAKEIKARLGVDVVVVPPERFEELLNSVDAAKAKAEADQWLAESKKVVEPTHNDVLKAAQVKILKGVLGDTSTSLLI